MPKEIEFKFASPNDSPGYLLGQATLAWQRQQRKVLDPLNLTHTQFTLLAALGWLAKTSDTVTQTDIARQSKSDTMMVSKVLRTLEAKNYLSRKEHPVDTRAKVIALTDAGAEILQRALKAVEDTDIAFFSVLGADLAVFNRCLERLAGPDQE